MITGYIKFFNIPGPNLKKNRPWKSFILLIFNNLVGPS